MERQSLYRQVYSRIVRSISQETLRSGQRVPSIRSLASELRFSKNTVEIAYGMLISDGYLEARGQAGTFVSSTAKITKHLKKHPPSKTPPHKTHTPHDQSTQSPLLPYQLGLPALDLFPQKLWSTLSSRQMRLQSKMLSYPAPAGYAPLRESISAYLQLSRGVDCSPEQVFITAGYQGALNLVGRTMFQHQDQVWIEDPCFPPARHLLNQLGASLVPVRVDEQGIRVEDGKARAPHARFALVTPAHQSPLGVSLSLKRRLELLEWANHNKAYIIEDDYDSEYCYDGRPQPALSSLATHDNVLYLGTFSKVLSPSLRLGYLVVPKSLVPLFNESCYKLNDGCPMLSQGVIAAFMQGGYFARHLRKMRAVYVQRREMVINSLLAEFGSRLTFKAPATGLHLLARLSPDEDDQLLAQRARDQHFGIAALSARSLEHDCGAGLLLGFANIATSEQAASLAHRLRLSLDAKPGQE
ncbi:PLP-dependent aminotransferase family protein [Pseudomonas fontis]|uniref:PLP-dependent aminotransferase family protein n=1 Tax=Pseudomonas fontis TaxID=2942633 RepID=A0ABT5NNE3_9PSED|nr:PLP-dependent aminotransferase family protein [Pseudomonas fontis]MDD0973179.1 PLP-dependent aminotransferase family protein [Pseudomonas fontis]MDD0989689.1 PLP-dependent aminotransferase family protein [Pseudomonas fontis]